ncbi:hypothetical protein NKW54_08545 [Acetobacter cerevisiae]|uniref:RNA polymerase sigma-70 region 4 domain-containing protein n=1 Tax=Acetobacter cerevisiae TaxID=178900 RepID=A0ABT1ERJ3_9PROT|nr:hypothetical protein [Acetobacter cerevisiae]MCP1245987.1 hypothetical protein [Acetobacter cerevisiae]MCP1255705.1 hypothetical protein [Acetobacter cerevisiae]
MTAPDAFARLAASRTTPPDVVMFIVEERRKGLSLREIGRKAGLCMEGVRQVLLHYTAARSEHSDDDEPVRDDCEPMCAGHPVSMDAIWRGLERWRGIDAVQVQ